MPITLQVISGFVLFVASLVVSVVLIRRRPVKLLAKIQLVLTILVVSTMALSILADVLDLCHVAVAESVRQLWTPRVEQGLFVFLFFPWLLFTIIHLILAVVVAVGRKLRARNEM
jgi:hypothetical protein